MDLNRVREIDGGVKVRHVLMSVADKTGAADFARGLVRINPDVMIYSTGGTFGLLQEALGTTWKKNLKQVSEYTGQPELQGGLVKTLDYRIYLGLLSETYNPSHQEDMKRTGAVAIDLAAVNLYPFASAVGAQAATLEDARTHIDIGGPCMLRASAKNFLRVASVCSPSEYPVLLDELERSSGVVSFETRFRLALKTFEHTAQYDAAIAGYLRGIPGAAAAAPYSFVKE